MPKPAMKRKTSRSTSQPVITARKRGPRFEMRRVLDMDEEQRRGFFARMGNDELRGALSEVLGTYQRRRKEWQLLEYDPSRVNPRIWEIHESEKRVTAIGGGNGSSKSESCLVDLVVRATGVVPSSWRERAGFDWRKKLRGPIQARVVIESLTTVLHPIMLPKLQWWKWTGVDPPGGIRGHWGWIPREHLIGGSWEKSWSEKHRMLRLIYRDPEDPKRIGDSTIQWLSRDQDPTDFASGDFHLVLHDEPPTLAIWRENEARTMRVGGQMMLAMTWPDDPAISVDWIHDEVYEPGISGKSDTTWINLWTQENLMLDQEAVSAQAAAWPEEIRRVRLRGEPIRFSNRIHPLFTERDAEWCFSCGKESSIENERCISCQSREVVRFTHVVEEEGQASWPCIFVMDPHPRKPHMFCWVRVDPSDDLLVVAEGEVDGEPEKVRDRVLEIESKLQLRTCKRMIDRNMALSPASARYRDRTWRDEFDAVGLQCDLSDLSDVGRTRVNVYLQPDPRTWRPRLAFHRRCERAIFQFKRYCWDEHKRATDRDLKQQPRQKYDDYPAMLRYCLNEDPSFEFLDRAGSGLRLARWRRS